MEPKNRNSGDPASSLTQPQALPLQNRPGLLDGPGSSLELAVRFRYSPLWLVAMIIFGVVYSVSSAFSQEQTSQPAASQAKPAEDADEALLKASQNPVADLISVSIQNHTNFGIAPYGRFQNVISLQPVIPLNLGENWMLIARIIQPIVWQPYPTRRPAERSDLET